MAQRGPNLIQFRPTAQPCRSQRMPKHMCAGRQADELMAEVQAWIEAEMRRLDPEAYADQA